MPLRSRAPDPRPARLLRLGPIDYLQAWELQRRLAEEVRGGAPEALVLCSHPPTVTLGRGATAGQMRVPQAVLEAHGVRVIDTDRGGGATVHNPGQLVGYPILRLGASPDLHRLLRSLEAALIRALSGFGVESERRDGLTGVWVEGAKIASIGMRFVRGVTLHGFALNVDNDLSLFEAIVPCGLVGVRTTSLALLGGAGDHVNVGMNAAQAAVAAAVADEFNLCYRDVTGECRDEPVKPAGPLLKAGERAGAATLRGGSDDIQ